MKNQFTIGVFGIIFDKQGRVLLCHRNNYDLWNLPRGALKSGEAPCVGAKREVKEETELEVEILKPMGVYSKQEKNEIIFSFICNIIGGEITLNNEANKIEYFEIDKIPSNTSPKQVERIKDAIHNPDIILKDLSRRIIN
jgi:ADP-ribose pyrophosphatase YjhB (NUDIX family)